MEVDMLEMLETGGRIDVICTDLKKCMIKYHIVD